MRKQKNNKTADKYTYRVVWSEEDQEHVGLCAEFPSLSWLEKSADDAFKGIRQLVAGCIQEMLEHKEPIPEPLSVHPYTGKFMVRVPPELHRSLAIQAAEQKVSLNRFVSMRLGG